MKPLSGLYTPINDNAALFPARLTPAPPWLSLNSLLTYSGYRTVNCGGSRSQPNFGSVDMRPPYGVVDRRK